MAYDDSDEYTEEFGPGLALILSNLFIIPAVASAIRHKLYAMAMVLGVMWYKSSEYHLCQADIACTFPFDVLQITDHFFVYNTLIWVSLYLIQVSFEARFILFALSQAIILPFVMTSLHNWWLGGGIVVGLLFLFVASLILWFRWKPKTSFIDLFVSLGLIGAGLYFHIDGGEPGETKYPLYHSIWHAFAMVSIFLAIELTEGKGAIRGLIKYITDTAGDSKRFRRSSRRSQVSKGIKGEDYYNRAITSILNERSDAKRTNKKSGKMYV